jgi:hypothetical protein
MERPQALREGNVLASSTMRKLLAHLAFTHQEQGVKAQGTREEITRELLDTIGDENAPVPVNDVKANMLSSPNKLSMP